MLGSDAHREEDVGDFTRTEKILKEVDFPEELIIIIGIVMKSTGFVPKDAGASVKKFLIYVTLPASIITNFSAIEDMGFNMLIIAALGILLNVIMIAVGALITRRKSKGEQALNMLCLPAFNIGAFCLPVPKKEWILNPLQNV